MGKDWKVKIIKYRPGQNESGCSFCGYGRGTSDHKGEIIWRVDFNAPNFGFFWLACNRCRFIIFRAFGLPRLRKMYTDTTGTYTIHDLVKKPSQKMKDTGDDILNSKIISLSWDRKKLIEDVKSGKKPMTSEVRDIFKWLKD